MIIAATGCDDIVKKLGKYVENRLIYRDSVRRMGELRCVQLINASPLRKQIAFFAANEGGPEAQTDDDYRKWNFMKMLDSPMGWRWRVVDRLHIPLRPVYHTEDAVKSMNIYSTRESGAERWLKIVEDHCNRRKRT